MEHIGTSGSINFTGNSVLHGEFHTYSIANYILILSKIEVKNSAHENSDFFVQNST